MDDKTKKWLEIGYKQFALTGPENLSIDKIAKEVGAARTAFYYHFSDIDSFIDELLAMHLGEANKIKENVIKNCKSYIPDYIKLISEKKIQVLFNKRLVKNRSIPKYLLTYNHINNIVDNATLDLWSADFGISGDRDFRLAVYSLLRDSFYNRITIDSMDFDSLIDIIHEIREITAKLIQNNLKSGV